MQTLLENNTVTHPPRHVDDMSLDEFVKWTCLLQAVETISEKADQLNIDFTKHLSIKSNTLNRYINEVFPSVRANFILENKINISI